MINIGDIIDDEDAYELFDKAEYVARNIGVQVGTNKGHKMYKDFNFVIDSNLKIDVGEKVSENQLSIFYGENLEQVYKYNLKRNFGTPKNNPEEGNLLKYVPGIWKEILNSNYSMALVN